METMKSRKLVLIRHSQSLPVPSISPDQWGLSEEGERRCQSLVTHLTGIGCGRIYTSPEPKALQTAQYVADHFDVHIEVHDDLREHDRSNEPWLDSQVAFEERVIESFHLPDQLIFGNETINQAAKRFNDAITEIVAQNPDQDVVTATHGTVMTLFVCQHNVVNQIEFWSSLGMPAIAVLSIPTYELVSVVEQI